MLKASGEKFPSSDERMNPPASSSEAPREGTVSQGDAWPVNVWLENEAI
jgi:hypothetical protein